jgi:hypothetical protein
MMSWNYRVTRVPGRQLRTNGLASRNIFDVVMFMRALVRIV